MSDTTKSNCHRNHCLHFKIRFVVDLIYSSKASLSYDFYQCVTVQDNFFFAFLHFVMNSMTSIQYRFFKTFDIDATSIMLEMSCGSRQKKNYRNAYSSSFARCCWWQNDVACVADKILEQKYKATLISHIG